MYRGIIIVLRLISSKIVYLFTSWYGMNAFDSVDLEDGSKIRKLAHDDSLTESSRGMFSCLHKTKQLQVIKWFIVLCCLSLAIGFEIEALALDSPHKQALVALLLAIVVLALFSLVECCSVRYSVRNKEIYKLIKEGKIVEFMEKEQQQQTQTHSGTYNINVHNLLVEPATRVVSPQQKRFF